MLQFATHAGPRRLLLSTASAGPGSAAIDLVESSPHDFFWGRGVDGSGANHLGILLMSIRSELSADMPDEATRLPSQDSAPYRNGTVQTVQDVPRRR